MLAQVDRAGDLPSYATGAGATAAVGGLVYIARLMATGRLVARDPALVEKTLMEMTHQLTKLVESDQEHEDDYRQFLLGMAAVDAPKRGQPRGRT